jgi:hypothetical protein
MGIPEPYDLAMACNAHGYGTKVAYGLIGNMLPPPVAACILQKVLAAMGAPLPKHSAYGRFAKWSVRGKPANIVETVVSQRAAFTCIRFMVK